MGEASSAGRGLPMLGLSDLVARIERDARHADRWMFGLAGPPGSGKSTVASHLAETLGAVVVPMDGFHLDNAELTRRGLADVKGAPETFDAVGFVRLVADLKQADRPVAAPSFDRVADRTIDAAITIDPHDRIVIVEGNYLLLEPDPWGGLRELFDATGYLAVDDDLRIERLIARHVEYGRSPDEAREFVRTSDAPNAALVAATRSRADLVIDPTRP